MTPLISSAAIDHIIPGSLNRKNFKRYEGGGGHLNEFKEFEARFHAPHHCLQLFLMEAVRKKAGVTRSAFILETLSAWKNARRRESAIKSYVVGYRETPEDPALAESLARAAAEILPDEDWT